MMVDKSVLIFAMLNVAMLSSVNISDWIFDLFKKDNLMNVFHQKCNILNDNIENIIILTKSEHKNVWQILQLSLHK